MYRKYKIDIIIMHLQDKELLEDGWCKRLPVERKSRQKFANLSLVDCVTMTGPIQGVAPLKRLVWVLRQHTLAEASVSKSPCPVQPGPVRPSSVRPGQLGATCQLLRSRSDFTTNTTHSKS